MVVSTQVFGENSPIFLEALDCTSADTNLLQCNSVSVPGIHSCTHSQDVSVRCTGEEIHTPGADRKRGHTIHIVRPKAIMLFKFLAIPFTRS